MTSVSCASSISGQKSSPKSQGDNRSKSCDTNCTSNSSCFFKKRKPMNPLAYAMRPTYHKTVNNPVKQRVMSAKLLKLRQLQSQLNDANFHLAEVARENQILKTLQKRQDTALSKYENTNADLPRLIHAHEEDIRVLTEKNKILRRTVKELGEQLKQREEELSRARDQLSHLERLDKDKHLTEREKLTDILEECKLKLQKSEEQVTTLNRKLLLETKASKQRLNAEMLKHKQCQKELLHAFEEIDRLTALLEAKENTVRPRNPKFSKFQIRHGMYHPPNRNLSNEKLHSQAPVTEVKLEPIVNGNNIRETENLQRNTHEGFKAPMESIRQRLSSGSTRLPQDYNSGSNYSSDISTESRDNSAGSLKSRPTSSLKLEKLPSVQENRRITTKMQSEDHTKQVSDVRRDDDCSDKEYFENEDIIVRYDYKMGVKKVLPGEEFTRNKISDKVEVNLSSRKDSGLSDQSGNSTEEDLESYNKKHREKRSLPQLHGYKRRSSDDTSTPESLQSDKDIEIMTENLDIAIQRVAQNSKDDFDKNLSSYCSEVLSSVKSCSKVIEVHKESLKHSKQDTNTLLDTLQKTEKIETKLKNSFFNANNNDMDLVNEILNEEHKFQSENKIPKSSARDQNSNKEKRSLVNLDNKKKLLATLRAIDNGDNVDSIEEPKQENVIKGILDNVAH